MKNLILIILAALMLASMASCTTKAVLEGESITKVEYYSNELSIYSTTGFKYDYGLPLENPSFIAHKGLYNVGDTLKFK